MLLVSLSFLAVAAVVRGQSPCGATLKLVTFDKHPVSAPYDVVRAKQDWAPHTYMDGWHGDLSTKGTDKERAWIVSDDRNGSALRLTYPRGCTTSACAMQAKTLLARPVVDATLQFKVKFGPGFDWVQGGKMPGLCGGRCLTGCKEVTGLDGWSSRHMWRPLRWPHSREQPSYTGPDGKLVAYVYHANKVHWCGDDFPFTHGAFRRTLPDGTDWSVVAPPRDQWLTVTNYVRMNTAGPASEGPAYRSDGVLRVWLDGLLVVDKPGMLWRKYDNVSIDTLYFSNFFGGSSVAFQATKDEHVTFDDIVVKEGKCVKELLPGHKLAEEEVVGPAPLPPLPRPDAATVDESHDVCPNVAPFYAGEDEGVELPATFTFWSGTLYGGCIKYEIVNDTPGACFPAARARLGGDVLTFKKAAGQFTAGFVNATHLAAHGERVLSPGRGEVLVLCMNSVRRPLEEALPAESVAPLLSLTASCLSP